MEPESLCCICQPGTLRHYRLPAQKCGGLFALQTKSPEHQPAAKSGRQSLEDTDNGKGQETDIGIPLGSENGLETKLEIFGFRGLMPVLCPATIGPKGKKYINPPLSQNKTGVGYKHHYK